MKTCDVLVVGAGPTGLVLALWLTRVGARVRIVDKTAGPGTTSRALAIQARTLELYRQLDLADAVVAKAHKVPGVGPGFLSERPIAAALIAECIATWSEIELQTGRPGKGGFGAFGPRLDGAGNSVKGQLAARYLSHCLGLSLFASTAET